MDDLLPLLIFAFVILGPLIERILKAGKKQEPPPPPEQRPRPQPRPPMRERMPEAEAERDRAGSAAEMLPDDLWAILTGEKKPERPQPTQRPQPPERPRQPAPARQPVPQGRRPGQPTRPPLPGRPTSPSEPLRLPQRPTPQRAEAPASLEEGTRRPVPREATAREEYVRQIPRYDAPEVVSMESTAAEAPLLEEHARHARFHDRLAGLAAPATVQKGPRSRGHAALNSRVELRRAIILREILGPPKSLE